MEPSTLATAFGEANEILLSAESLSSGLEQAFQAFKKVDRSELPAALREDFDLAVDAMEKATRGDLSGVAAQYERLVHTELTVTQQERIFFTIWNRMSGEDPEPCVLLCRVDIRGLGLLQISRSRAFVECLVKRLGETSYPEAILDSRLQGVEIILSAGRRPPVLFADFVAMGPDSGIDPATGGGLLFSTFGDMFLEEMPLVERAFPNVAEWLTSSSLLNRDSIRLLTTAHVQAHDLCGHSVPYHLNDPTRLKVESFLRTPLEEYYADTQAMWIYSNAASTRPFFTANLSETELDAIPLVIAMKRLTYYAMKDVSDHDARCSWMMFGYWRKAGLIRRLKSSRGEFFFDIERMPEVLDQMLSDILHVEHEIGQGAEAYHSACRDFSRRFGFENPVTRQWEMPDDLWNLLTP
ncbi:MAG TPA: hypothetical protein VIE43_09590 [Thermoanaerobaculia bacterium]|nr:hypothetical protein [Thermoanaerobaculia bacterium]